MKSYTCKECGVQQTATNLEPKSCPICADRYEVPNGKQEWLHLKDHQNQHPYKITEVEPNISKLSIDCGFGIGQTAHLLETQSGNYLWDCIPLINDQLIADIKTKGGLKAIAISHPHFYSNMVDWSKAFGDIPIYIHKNDQQYALQTSKNITFWQGDELKLQDDVTLIKLGGHYPGSSIMFWQGASDHKNVILVGDTIAPTRGNKNVIFRNNFNISIPLHGNQVEHIQKIISPYHFDRIYGAFSADIIGNADNVVQQSIKHDLESRQIMKMNQITLSALDLTETKQFYINLGCELIVDGNKYIRLIDPDGENSFSFTRAEQITSTDNCHIYFEFKTVDALNKKVESLANLGLDITRPTDQRWLWREAITTDPSGYIVKLYHAGENRIYPPWGLKEKTLENTL